MIKVYSLRWAPPFVRGFVRDVRVRWALEEAKLPYENAPENIAVLDVVVDAT